jgi:hypothetical protein
MSRPPKANVQVEKGGVSSSSHAKMPPKETSSIIKVQCSSSNGAPDVGSSIHPVGKVLQRQTSTPSKGPQVI